MKRSLLYSGMAASNIKKNIRLYLPRILAEAGLLGSFYIVFTLARDERLANALGGTYLGIFMSFGTVIIGFMSLIIIMYVNGFLMKQRKSEYGLYNVLGMEKRHIIRVLFCESLFSSIVSMVLGILFGILFYKLSSLLICRLLRGNVVAGFYYVKWQNLLFPVVVFLCFDFIAFLAGGISILRLKPVELLAGKRSGEKEPRNRLIMLVLGVLSLGGGYYIALTTQSPLQAIYLFFIAVMLVIIGTYFLFMAGTTFVLKLLRMNKKYYYQKWHMPAVSGLLFRMKQNAVGLASIAILATEVLVMISTTVSLYAGVQDMMETNYPKQLYLTGNYQEGDKVVNVSFETLKTCVEETAREKGVEIEEIEDEQMLLTVSYLLRDNTLYMKSEISGPYDISELVNVTYITEDTYSQVVGKKMSNARSFDLMENEIVFCQITTSVDHIKAAPKSLVINGREYTVKKELGSFPVQLPMGSTIVSTIGIVVPDEAALMEIYQAQKEGYGEFASEFSSRIGVSFVNESAVSAVGEEFNKTLYEKLYAHCPENARFTLDTKWESLHNVLEMFGTFLFLGILLGFVCLFSTILIIYYKQISEGYDDRERFQIMEKIGMDTREVKKTIDNQLLLQFFLPLVTAGIHTTMAFPILIKLLRLLMMTNVQLFVICTVITFALFAVVYVLVYRLTARTYYRIVH